MARFEELVGDLLNPSRDGCGEHKTLKVFQASRLNLVYDEDDVFFEAEIQHLISLIQDSVFQVREVKVLALDMVNDTAASTNENIDTTSQLVGLLVDVATSVDCEHIILAVVELECLQFFCDLKSKLSCGSQDHSLRSA